MYTDTIYLFVITAIESLGQGDLSYLYSLLMKKRRKWNRRK